jgi:hypothetical protein
VTACVLPDTNAVLIVFVTDEPAVTDLLPELLREKSNETSFVNHALACELGVIPLLKAWALTSEVAVRLKGALYCLEDCVGVVPSVV